jgi:hypothetical protein
MKVHGWYLVSDPGVEPIATRVGDGWLHVEETKEGADLEVYYCEAGTRLRVPVAVVELLLDLWRKGRKP